MILRLPIHPICLVADHHLKQIREKASAATKNIVEKMVCAVPKKKHLIINPSPSNVSHFHFHSLFCFLLFLGKGR